MSKKPPRQEPPPRTGWRNGLLQDQCKPLGKWFASRIDARWAVRKACELIRAEREKENAMNNKTEQAVKDVLPCPFCGSTEGFYVEEGSTFRWRVISCRNCGEGTEVRHKNNSDEPDSYIADWNAAAPYPAMLRKELDTLRAQLAEAQRDAERLDWIIEHRAYVVSDPDCCDGYWLNYARPDGTMWTQATEHETPRAAIDAAKGESNG